MLITLIRNGNILKDFSDILYGCMIQMQIRFSKEAPQNRQDLYTPLVEIEEGVAQNPRTNQPTVKFKSNRRFHTILQPS